MAAEPGSPEFLVGCAVLFVCSTLAAAGGIGGGALNVPILLAVFGYSYKEAVVLSLCAVAGNTLSQVIVNSHKSHPLDKTRPIIYFDAALLLIPAQLGGNNIGVLLAAVLPTTILMVIAICVILFAVYMTTKKGVHLYEVESAVKGHAGTSGSEKESNSAHGGNSSIFRPTGPSASSAMEQEQGPGRWPESESSDVIEVSLMIHEGVAPRPPAPTDVLTDHGDTVVVLENENTGETKVAMFSRFSGSTVTIEDGKSSSSAHHMVLVESATQQKLVIDTFTEQQLVEQSLSRASAQSSRRTSKASSTSKTSKRGGAGATADTGAADIEQLRASLVDLHRSQSAYGGDSDSVSKGNDPGTDTEADVQLDIVYPMISVYVLLVVLAYFIAVNTGMAEVPKCGDAYWVILALSYPGLAVIVYYCINYTSEQQELDPDGVLPGDLNCTKDKFLRPTVAFVIGIACSLLGIGGGELFGPVMLTMKIIPQVSSGTTSLMSLISSINNIIHHIVIEDLPYLSGLILFGVGMSAGVIGRVGALKITKIFGRPSILIFILATILFTSSIIMVVEMTSEEASFSFDPVCVK